MQVNPPVNQKELYKAAFAKIQPFVTASDREAALKTLPVRKNTIINYLRGNRIANFDTAHMLLTFFNKRIEDRSSQVKEIINN